MAKWGGVELRLRPQWWPTHTHTEGSLWPGGGGAWVGLWRRGFDELNERKSISIWEAVTYRQEKGLGCAKEKIDFTLPGVFLACSLSVLHFLYENCVWLLTIDSERGSYNPEVALTVGSAEVGSYCMVVCGWVDIGIKPHYILLTDYKTLNSFNKM
jgi:hypothetical protein